MQSRPRITALPADFETEVLRRYQKIFNQAIEDVFQKLPLSTQQRKDLRRIAVGIFVHDLSNISWVGVSGLVIAGFGSEEIYPSIISYEIESVVADRLKYKEGRKIKIGKNQHRAALIPFAQSEMVISFMEGIAPDYKTTIQEYLRILFERYPEELIKVFTHLSDARKKKLSEQMQKVGADLSASFWTKVEEWAVEKNIEPVISTVAVLPKDELASMAESLVNLTSFKRRVTLVAETVGGPIDVAVISKGDGFVWIKRKHYFESEENPHFLKNYYR